MKKLLRILAVATAVLFSQAAAHAQGATCATSTILCSPNASFAAPTNAPSLPNHIGCLTTAPNPGFYTLNIAQSGVLSLTIPSSPCVDIDYAIWGPFSSVTGNCGANVPNGTPVDCSYQGGCSSNEHISVPNALQGETYILLLTNFSGQSTNVTLQPDGANTAVLGGPGVLLGVSTLVAAGPYSSADAPVNLLTNPPVTDPNFTNENFAGTGVTDNTNGVFDPAGLAAGSYSVTLTGTSYTCSVSSTTTVHVQCPTGSATPANNGPVCPGSSLDLTVPAGNAGNTYAWSGPNGYSSTSQNPSLTYSAAAAGTYNVTVTASNGCSLTGSTTVATVVVSTPTGIDETVCSGTATSTLGVSGTTGTVNWYDAATGGNLVNTGTTYIFTPSSTATYYVEQAISGCSSSRTPVTVTVNNTPSAPVAVDETICPTNSTTTYGVSGTTGTVNWYDAATGGNLVHTGTTYVFSPSATTTYYVDETTASCTSPRTPVTVTVSAGLTPVITATAGTICAGENTTLSSAGWATYNWSTTDATPTTTVSPANTATYSVTVSDASGCTGTSSYTVTVTPVPTAPTASGTTICAGNTTTLTTATAGTINWYDAATGGNLLGTGSSFTTPVLNTNTTYYAEANVSACASARTTVAVTVNAIPSAPIAVDETICAGNATATYGVAGTTGTVNWYDAATGGNLVHTGTTYSFSPANTTTYYTDQTISGCTSSRTAVVATVNPVPAPNIAASASTICSGNSTTLTATAGVTYAWNTGAATNPITVSPANTATYNVTATNASGCTGSASFTVTVIPTPTAPSISPATICAGNTATLTTASAGAINWYDAATGGNLLTTGASLTTLVLQNTTVYYADATQNGCTSARTSVTVTVNPIPSAPIPANQTVCAGNATTTFGVTATTGTVNWYDAALAGNLTHTGATYIQTPIATTTYYVDQTVLGCTSPRTPVTVTVNALPTPSISASANPICAGNSSTLTATGGASYNWNTGAATASITVSPANTAIYTVTATSAAGCTATASYTLNVTPIPTAPVAAGATICAGNTTYLSTPALGTIVWYDAFVAGNVVSNGANFITPVLNANMTYYVETTVNGCTSPRTQVDVTVYAIPSAPVAVDQSVCAGNATTTYGVSSTTGTVNWYTAATGGTQVNAGATYVFTPSLTTTYYVDQTVQGCTSSRTPVTVTVNALPTPSVSASADPICAGVSSTLTATGGATYAWNTGTATATNTVSPANTTTYTVTATSAAGCTATAGYSLTVIPVPAAPVTAGPTICAGNTAYLSTSTLGTIVWYDAAIAGNVVANGANFITPVLNANMTYYVETTVNGCTSPRTQVTVTVNAIPSAPVAVNESVCAGNATTTLGVSGTTGTVNWYTEQVGGTLVNTGTTYVLTPSATTTFYVDQTLNACTSSPRTPVTVTVNALPTPSITGTSPICSGSSSTLTATGGVTYSWSTTQTGNSITVSPATTTPYAVTATDANTCSATASFVLTVIPTPATPVVTNSGPVCAGEPIVLSSSILPGATYLWAGPGGFASALQAITLLDATAANAGTYSVTVTANGCSSLPGTTTVVVNALPVLPSAPTSNSPVCEHSDLNLTAPVVAGLNYQWTGPNGFTSTQPSPTITNVNPFDNSGFYNLILTNANGCTSAVPYVVVVEVNPKPTNIAVINNGPVCQGEPVVLTAPAIAEATYAWSGPNSFAATTRVATVTPAVAGTYNVVVTVSGCSSVPASTDVVVHPLPVIHVTHDTTVALGVPVEIVATGGLYYEWNPFTFLTNSNLPNPVATPPIGVTTYTATGYNEYGCSDTASVRITVTNDFVGEVPNLITPNGDGVNDTWVMPFLQHLNSAYSLQIYARGGTLVYTTSAYANDWGGTMNGTALPDGAYWYIIHTADRDYKGAITVKR